MNISLSLLTVTLFISSHAFAKKEKLDPSLLNQKVANVFTYIILNEIDPDTSENISSAGTMYAANKNRPLIEVNKIDENLNDVERATQNKCDKLIQKTQLKGIHQMDIPIGEIKKEESCSGSLWNGSCDATYSAKAVTVEAYILSCTVKCEDIALVSDHHQVNCIANLKVGTNGEPSAPFKW